MYHGTGQGGWNQQQQGNAYPQMQQYPESGQQPYRPQTPYGDAGERQTSYGYPMERRPENPAFTSPPRMQTPGTAVRNPWEGQVRGPSPYQQYDTQKMHPNYYKNAGQAFPVGQYSNMDNAAAIRQNIPGAAAIRHPERLQMQNPYQQPNMSTEVRYGPASANRQIPSQYSSQMMHTRSEQPGQPQHVRHPGVEYNYSRGPVASQQRYPYGQVQYASGRGTAQSYPAVNHPAMPSQSVQYQNSYHPSHNAMTYNNSNRYQAPGSATGMLSPNLKSSQMQAMSHDPSNRLQTSLNAMPNYSPRPGSRNPSFDGGVTRMPTAMLAGSIPQPQIRLGSNNAKTGYSENFNLDSLLDDSVGSGGSLLQQLEDVPSGTQGSNSNQVAAAAPAPVPDGLNALNIYPQEQNQTGLLSQQLAQPGPGIPTPNFAISQFSGNSGGNMVRAPVNTMSRSLPQPNFQLNPLSSNNMTSPNPGLYSAQNMLQSPQTGMPIAGTESRLLSPHGQSGNTYLKSPQSSISMASPEHHAGPSPHSLGRSPQHNMPLIGSPSHGLQPQQQQHPMQVGQSPKRNANVMGYQSHSYQAAQNLGQSPQRPSPLTSPQAHFMTPSQNQMQKNMGQSNTYSQQMPGVPTSVPQMNQSLQNTGQLSQNVAMSQSYSVPVHDQSSVSDSRQNNQGPVMPMASPPNVLLHAKQNIVQPAGLPSMLTPQASGISQSPIVSPQLPHFNNNVGHILEDPLTKTSTMAQLPTSEMHQTSQNAVSSFSSAPSMSNNIAPVKDYEIAVQQPDILTSANSPESLSNARIAADNDKLPVKRSEGDENTVSSDPPAVQANSVEAENEVADAEKLNQQTVGIEQAANNDAADNHVAPQLNVDANSAQCDSKLNIPSEAENSQNNVDVAMQLSNSQLTDTAVGAQPQSKFTPQAPHSAPQRHALPGPRPNHPGPFNNAFQAQPHDPRMVGPQSQSSAIAPGLYQSSPHSKTGPGPVPQNVPRYHAQNMLQSPQRGGPMMGPQSQPGPGVHHPSQPFQQGTQPQPGMRHPSQNVYPQSHAMPGQHRMAQPYPRPGFGPGQEQYRYHAQHNYPQTYGPQNARPGVPGPYYPQQPDYRMQSAGGMPPRHPHIPQQFRGPPPRHMHPYPYSQDGGMPHGWPGPVRPPVGPHGPMHGGIPGMPQEHGKPEKTSKKSKSSKDPDGTPKAKKERVKKISDKKAVNAQTGMTELKSPDSTKPASEKLSSGKVTEKKRKKPPATFKMKKKKRKKGEDVEEFEGMLPGLEMDNIEKRRSSRNVKRKQYTESYELQLSDDVSDDAVEEAVHPMKGQLAGLMVEEPSDDKLIVERILDVRMKKVLVKESKKENEDIDDGTQLEDGKKSVEEIDVADNVNEPMETETNEVKEKSETNEEIPTEIEKTKERKFSRNDDETDPEKYEEVEEYFVKYKNYSYLHCDWKTRDEFQDKRVDAKIKRYRTKMSIMPEYLKMELNEAFNPDFVEVERVLDVGQNDDESGEKGEKHYFTKWCALPYEDSTWESESDIPKEKIIEFEARCQYRPPDNPPSVPHKNSFRKLIPADGVFLNNNKLRDYQLEGINWLLFNWYNRRNCILADEMGLGKTIQSITFLQKIFDHGIEGPFLIVAPLSTICNWQREFSTWTHINAVVYHGGQASRDMIKTYEFLCRDENLDEIPGTHKMHVVITTYEMIALENSHLQDIEWKCSIIDEAHRLKNQSCKLADALRNMHLDFKVLLTGTPLQNNVEELFALLNFLQPEIFDSTEAFMAEFGDLKNNTQVEKLQELLKPMMLRRLKEDVEKSLAPKEETIIEVELTNIQKKYYRAIMERNFEFLSKGAVAGNVPNLMNTMMELRKCCNHPYLIKGAEDKIHFEQSGDEQSSLQLMIQSAGKLVLIDKLLPKLKAGGHRVLIFSQMVRCLDILEDYLVHSQYSYERIDGGVRGSDRQAAIDRFSRPDSERFVFLLCTRAGGLGINLTAADTVIIFDSDWNPQNDLQAQARCHRIGQKKTVKIYRLITRNSYERQMFDKASLKLGLDKAVLQSISGRQDEVNSNSSPALSKQEVEDLLKLGAYGSIMDEDEDSKKFCEEDIDQILSRRTHTITIAPGEKGSTFSKASFISGEEGSEISLNDPDFWEKWAKKADLDIDRLTNNKLIIEEPRRRKQTRRFGGMSQDVEILAEIGSDSDSDYDEKVQAQRQKKKSRTRNWGKKDYFRVEKSLLTFGWGRWKHMLAKGGFPGQLKLKELETVCRAMLMYCLKFYIGDEKIKIFMWNLITPANCSSANVISSLEGLTAPVSRGRKGRHAKDASESGYDQISQEWIKEVDVNAILQEDSFKKHLQHHSNKILLRVRMLYFLKTEILASVTEDMDEMSSDKLELNFPDIMPENLFASWDFECDKNLLLGVHKHGFGKYSLVRADPKLCFLRKFGMPDEKAIADDLDNDGEEDNEDPEYKPTKLNFSEYSEFEQDSPASNNPGTAPASPASSIDSTKDSSKVNTADDKEKTSTEEDKKETTSSEANNENEEEDEDEKSESKQDDEKKEEDTKKEKEATEEEAKPETPSWPSTAELNMRVRRIVACYQKQHKQIRSRLMNLDQNSPKNKMRESARERAHWTRREEADFYRTVSTFGVEFTKKGFTWTRFRLLAKLDKKSDKSLDMYYLAFKSMCERACGHKTPLPDEIATINVTRVTEERASRTLYRIELLNRIRIDVLKNKNLEENMKKCEKTIDLPAWWKPGFHDKELLLGMDRHGVTRTEIHILNDTTLSFLKTMFEYEQQQYSQKRRKRNHSPDLSSLTVEKRKKGEDTEENMSEVDGESGDKSTKISASLSKEEDTMFLNHIFNTQKWPKDRILIQRVEHICYCVINGKWPISRAQEDVAYMKTQMNIASLPTVIKPLSKSGSNVGDTKSLLDEKGLLPDNASERILSIIRAQSREAFKPKKMAQGDNMQSNKLNTIKTGDSVSDHQSIQPHSDPLLNLCLTNSKFNETLQTLLKSDLSRLNMPQATLLSEAMGLSQAKPKESKRPKEEFTPVKTEKDSPLQGIFGSGFPKKKEDKGIMKKKSQKSRTGFISPAVLPPDARIPVYNPTEKKKLSGEDAPLNKDLADWLKQHSGYVVDYKSLRQKISDESPSSSSSKDNNSSSVPASSNSPVESKSKHSKSSSEHRKTPDESSNRPSSREREREQRASEREARQLADRSLEHAINSHQASLLNQSLINPSAGLLSALYGNSPEMNALIASGMMGGLPPFLPEPTSSAKDTMFHQQQQQSSSNQSSSSSSQSHNREKKHKNHTHSSKTSTPPQPQFQDNIAQMFGLGNMQAPADAATLAALFGGFPPPTGKDAQKQLKQMFEQPMMQFDPKAMGAMGAFGGLNMSPFFPGMPGAMNPLLYGMYANPELAAMPELFHPAHMSSFLESEYPKLKNAENLNALQELLGVQNSMMANMGFDINNPDFQKFVRSQEALQQPMAPSLGKTPAGQSEFDDSLRSVYQQLHSSSLQKEHENRKKEKMDRHEKERKNSPSEDETPIDLRRTNSQKKK